MEDKAMVEYTASDGQNVKLSPAIVAKYIVSGDGEVSDKDMFAFMAQCQARGLNPLAKDCYMTVYRNRDNTTSVSVIVSKDYFVRTATQQEDFDGMSAGVVVINRDGELVYRQGSLVGTTTEKLVGGWAEVYSKKRSHPSRAEVSLNEYNPHRSLWTTKPATMIRKVALVQALREAYPEKFAGVYDSSEMPDATPAEAELETIEPDPYEPMEDDEALPPLDELYEMEDF